jgi:hypothetical protein
VSEPVEAPDSITRLGLGILDFGDDPRYLGLAALFLLLLFAVVYRMRRGVWPRQSDWLRAGLALLATFSGVLTAAIFLLTKPPAIDRLSHEMQATLGVVMVVVFCGFVVREMSGIFSKGGAERAVPTPAEGRDEVVAEDEEPGG